MEKDIVKKLQEEAKNFITQNILVLKNFKIKIYPKEIEVYYYNDDFKDNAVHRKPQQTMKFKNHFYVHRCKNSDSYKGGNRAGVDFVVSDDENTYYSYLIRSTAIKINDEWVNEGNTIVGPNNVLKTICNVCKVSFEDLEKESVTLEQELTLNDGVLISKRINLSKGLIDEELRFVLCDKMFLTSKYPQKENMIVNFLTSVNNQDMPKDPIDFCKKKLNYIPSEIKKRYGNKHKN